MKLIFSVLLLFITSIYQQDQFTFVNGNQKILLKIDNVGKNLNWEKKSILNLALENIDPKKVSVSAPGIKFLNVGDKELNLEVTPTKEVFKSDTLNLNVGYKDGKNSFVSHTFSLLIK